MLKLENISAGYGSKVLLNKVHTDVPQGTLVGVLGVNGIGKSTLLKTIAGLISPIEGKVLIDAKDIQTLSASQKADVISVAGTERPEIMFMTVKEFAALGKMRFTNSFNMLSPEHLNDVNEVLLQLKMNHLTDKYIGEISDGEKQKAVIARAVVQDSPVIVLDEPTAFLDFRNKKLLFNYLTDLAQNKGKIVLASTHDIDLAFTYCNAWWVIDDSKNFYALKSADEAKAILKA